MLEIDKSVIFFPLFEINYAFGKAVRMSKTQSHQGNKNSLMDREHRSKF